MSLSSFPIARPRRLRRDAATRDLVREHRLGAEDLILPVFVHGLDSAHPVPSMPGVSRLGIEQLLPVAERAQQLGIRALALFPVIDAAQKDAEGREALNPDGWCRTPCLG